MRDLLRLIVIVGGTIALVAFTTLQLGALAGFIVLPVAALLCACAVYATNLPAQGYAMARRYERYADYARMGRGRAMQRLAAEQLDKAAASLREFVDDGSADDEIARLEAEAFWCRKRGKG